MKPNQNDLTPAHAAAALLWLVDMGADEIVGEAAIDRFAASAAQVLPSAPVASASRPVAPIVAKATPARSVAPPQTGNLIGDARGLAAGCTTVAALVDVLNTLESSALRKSASNLCFIDAKPDCAVMVIGDKPGTDEDIAGQPFAGKNVVLLHRMLAAIGLDPAAVTFANVVPWRPPGNRLANEPEIQTCLPFIRRAIDIVRPKLILTLGALPAIRLAGGDEAFTRQRGKWLSHGLEDGSSIPVMPTYHPEFLLKQPGQKKQVWRDLLAFKERMP